MFQPTERDLRALELADRKMSVKDELGEYHQLIDTLIYLNEGLKEAKTEIKYWQQYSETLLIKICFHALTIHQILEGLTLQSKYYPKELNGKIIVDRASAIVLLRSQLEAFLMYRHLYVNPKSDDEKELRYNAWIYASLYQRQSFPSKTEYAQIQREKDKKELETIRNRIQTLKSFKSLNQKQQTALLTAGSHKLFNHWGAILKESGYEANHAFSINYAYWSAYAHSEGVSAIQLHSTALNFDNHNRAIISDIQTSKLIISIMIILLKDAFVAAEIKYNILPNNLRYDVEFYVALSKRTQF
jgi:hypothetical protein